MDLVKATDRAIAAENQRHLADPNLESDLERDLALWQALEDAGEIPMTSRDLP